METGTDTTPLYTLISGDVGTREVFSSLGYIPTETGTDTPPIYTLISGDMGTWVVFSRIYRCGDRDRHTTLYTLISGDVGTRGVFSRIYTYGDRDRHTTHIHSHFWGRGDTGSIL